MRTAFARRPTLTTADTIPGFFVVWQYVRACNGATMALRETFRWQSLASCYAWVVRMRSHEHGCIRSVARLEALALPDALHASDSYTIRCVSCVMAREGRGERRGLGEAMRKTIERCGTPALLLWYINLKKAVSHHIRCPRFRIAVSADAEGR